MRTAELKEKLITKIKSSDDSRLLEDIYGLLEDEPTEVYSLSEDQIKAIKSAQQEISAGKFFSDDEVRNRTRKWLEK